MTHLDALAEALENERRALTAEAAALRALPMAARIAAGFTVSPLDIVTVEHRSRDRVNVILRGKDIGEAFSPGDPVVLGPVGRPDEGWPGRIEGLDGATIELRVEGVPEGRGT